MNIQQTLIQKYKQDELGHFYILTPGRDGQQQDFLTDWAHLLLSQLLEIKEIINHEDFLEIAPSAPNGNYSLEDFSPLFSFLNYKATRAQRKFILIHNADKFSHYVSNKLLKTLEEPPVKTTIFLLNPTGKKLLPTIESRGIKLRIPISTPHCSDSEIEKIKQLAKLPLHKIVEELRNEIGPHEQILKALTTWCNTNEIHFATISQLQQILLEYEQDQLYHNAPTHRIYAVANLIKELSPSI